MPQVMNGLSVQRTRRHVYGQPDVNPRFGAMHAQLSGLDLVAQQELLSSHTDRGYHREQAALAPRHAIQAKPFEGPEHAGDSDPKMAQRIGQDIATNMARANSGDVYYRTNTLPGPHKGQNALYKDGYASPAYFQPCLGKGESNRYHFFLLPGVSAFEAIEAWMDGVTVAECASTAMATQLHAVAKEMGKPAFDKMCNGWKGAFIAPKITGTPLDMLTSATAAVPKHTKGNATMGIEQVRGKSFPVKVGDKAYAANHPDYITLDPGGLWSGEHVICSAIVDKGGTPTPMWSGFGAATHTSEDMLAMVYEAYRKAALLSPKYIHEMFGVQLGNPVTSGVRDHFQNKHTQLEKQGQSSLFFNKIQSAEAKLKEAFDAKAGFRLDEIKRYSWQIDTQKVGAAKRRYGSS